MTFFLVIELGLQLGLQAGYYRALFLPLRSGDGIDMNFFFLFFFSRTYMYRFLVLFLIDCLFNGSCFCMLSLWPSSCELILILLQAHFELNCSM